MNLREILTYSIGVPIILGGIALLHFQGSEIKRNTESRLDEVYTVPGCAYTDRHGRIRIADPKDPNTWPGL